MKSNAAYQYWSSLIAKTCAQWAHAWILCFQQWETLLFVVALSQFESAKTSCWNVPERKKLVTVKCIHFKRVSMFNVAAARESTVTSCCCSFVIINRIIVMMSNTQSKWHLWLLKGRNTIKIRVLFNLWEQSNNVFVDSERRKITKIQDNPDDIIKVILDWARRLQLTIIE